MRHARINGVRVHVYVVIASSYFPKPASCYRLLSPIYIYTYRVQTLSLYLNPLFLYIHIRSNPYYIQSCVVDAPFPTSLSLPLSNIAFISAFNFFVFLIWSTHLLNMLFFFVFVLLFYNLFLKFFLEILENFEIVLSGLYYILISFCIPKISRVHYWRGTGNNIASVLGQ